VRERAGEAHPIVEAAVLGQPSQAGDELLVEVQRADADASPSGVVDRGQRVEQDVMALDRGDGADAEQPPTRRGTRCHFGCVDAGRHDVHGSAGQRVVVAQPLPGPLARGHDRGRRRQRRDLARLVLRHVQKYDEAEPTGFGLQDLRHHRRDQAVDEYQCSGRHLGQRRSHARPGLPVGPGTSAGRSVLVDRPAKRGKPATGPAVVHVAAARPPRVVDSVGDHDVHLAHNDLS
jgi:hypothetical protein